MYYVKKIIAPSVHTDYHIFINGAYATTHTVDPINGGDLQLKYMDTFGQFRFLPVLCKHSEMLKNENIGELTNVVDSMALSYGNTKSVGNKTDLKIIGYTDFVDPDNIKAVTDLFRSPTVYINYNEKWQYCTVISKEVVSRNQYTNAVQYRLQIEIKELNNITEL